VLAVMKAAGRLLGAFKAPHQFFVCHRVSVTLPSTELMRLLRRPRQSRPVLAAVNLTEPRAFVPGTNRARGRWPLAVGVPGRI
jgi:hypothetical protein